jgi:hypothetical protein
MKKALFLITILTFTFIKVSAYEYRISADNKYHSEPLNVVNSDIEKSSDVVRISSSILRPVGQVFGGLIIGLANGLSESVDSES